MTYRRLASLDQFDERGMLAREVDGVTVLLIRLPDGVHALEGICTHEYAELYRGIVAGSSIICPLHLSKFNIFTGEVETPPATEALRTFDVRIEGQDVLVDV
ncbi:MAG: non-heme iron oxygenase ferredoxin subunit [Methanomassiliicoccales archaeon]